MTSERRVICGILELIIPVGLIPDLRHGDIHTGSHYLHIPNARKGGDDPIGKKRGGGDTTHYM